MNVVQEHYACNQKLSKMRMDHAEIIDGGNMHLRLVVELR